MLGCALAALWFAAAIQADTPGWTWATALYCLLGGVMGLNALSTWKEAWITDDQKGNENEAR